MEDHSILDLFFARQESAIAETKRKYGGRLYRTAMHILYCNEDAEECVSDALLKAWDAIPPTRPEKFGAFLAKITRNLSINRWEAKSAEKRGGGEMDLLLSELEDCIPASDGPEDAFEATVVTDAINVFLETLEQSARVAFVLRYFHGEPIRDIAERFQMSESKVKSMLFRIRKKLLVHLEKEGVIV
ncbi:MAG: sigma-70 family RNA polymerase sigma factor [Oscillospiraceae bacterium]|nr:sigma-70 family RNA polymerase sigma factor [Oscillospiraceae bacterium]